MRALWLFLIAIAHSAAAVPPPEITSVRLERSACYGANYAVELRSDGTIAYDRFLADTVEHSVSKTTVADFQRIARKVDEIDFYGLADEYLVDPRPEVPVELSPTTTTTVATPNGGKTVKRRLNTRQGLLELESLIHEICGIQRWLKERSNQAMQLTRASLRFTLPVPALVRLCCVACTEGSRQLIL